MGRIDPAGTWLTKEQADELNERFGDSASYVLPLFHVGIVTPGDIGMLEWLGSTGPVPMSELIARHRRRMAEKIRAVNRRARNG